MLYIVKKKRKRKKGDRPYGQIVSLSPASYLSDIKDRSSLFFLTRMQVGCPDSRPKAGWIGELELPPVADPALLLCPLRVHVQREAWMLPTQREGVCSYRLIRWLIDLQRLYSFTTGFEIQHCTWGAMCVPSLSPFQSFPRSSFLRRSDFCCVAESVHQLIVCDVTCCRWALSPLQPRVPISSVRPLKPK